jgi:hypothetical protein
VNRNLQSKEFKVYFQILNGDDMVSVTYRISIPRSVVEMLEKINAPVNKDTFKEMTELYVKIKSSVPHPKAEEMVMLYTELERNGTLTKAWELAKRLSTPQKPMISHYEVIKRAVDTYEFLIIRGLKSVPDMINDFEDFIKLVEDIIINSNEFKSLPEEDRSFIVKSLPYFAFNTLVLKIFRKWIEANPQKILEIAKEVFSNKEIKEDKIINKIDI